MIPTIAKNFLLTVQGGGWRESFTLVSGSVKSRVVEGRTLKHTVHYVVSRRALIMESITRMIESTGQRKVV